MEDIIKGLIEKVGISEEQAKGVITFLQENASKIPALLQSSGIADKLPGGLGDLLGGGGDDDDKKESEGGEDGGESSSNPLAGLFG